MLEPGHRMHPAFAPFAFAPYEKGGWRRLHRRLGDLLLTFAWEQKAPKQRQEQIPPAPLFQRRETQFPAWVGGRA
jgi:hypothetical protein